MNKKILIVDDSATIRNLVKLALKLDGYEITSAIDGQDALEKLGKINVDMLITDLNMPNMDGRELIRNVREIPEFANLPIIVLSSLSSSKDISITMEIGADSYVTKPFDNLKLRAEIAKFLKD